MAFHIAPLHLYCAITLCIAPWHSISPHDILYLIIAFCIVPLHFISPHDILHLSIAFCIAPWYFISLLLFCITPGKSTCMYRPSGLPPPPLLSLWYNIKCPWPWWFQVIYQGRPFYMQWVQSKKDDSRYKFWISENWTIHIGRGTTMLYHLIFIRVMV